MSSFMNVVPSIDVSGMSRFICMPAWNEMIAPTNASVITMKKSDSLPMANICFATSPFSRRPRKV